MTDRLLILFVGLLWGWFVTSAWYRRELREARAAARVAAFGRCECGDEKCMHANGTGPCQARHVDTRFPGALVPCWCMTYIAAPATATVDPELEELRRMAGVGGRRG